MTFLTSIFTHWPQIHRRRPQRWLAGLDWPPTAYEDFDQIAKFNEKYFEITGQKRPTTQPTSKRRSP